MNNIAGILLENEIKPSYQRMKVMEYLNENRIHPTVEQIYSELKPEIPTLSKATVYNTLKLFEAKQLVKSITIEDNEVRYDADVKDHGHFKCQNCGMIVDFPILLGKVEHDALKNYQVHQRDVFFRGLCSDCKE